MSEKSINILLVENEDYSIDKFKKSFGVHSKVFNIIVKKDLSEADLYLKNNQPDMIVANLSLPDGNGLDFVDKNKIKQNFPVLILGNVNEENHPAEIVNLGILDYIIKSDASIQAMPQIVNRAFRLWESINERNRADEELRKYHEHLEATVRERTLALEQVNKELKLEAIERQLTIDALLKGEEKYKKRNNSFAKISHELRTPLNAIIGFTELIKLKKKSLLDEECVEFVDSIQDSSEFLLEMVNDILDFSKLEAGSLSISKDLFDLNDLIQTIPGIINGLLNDKKLELNIEIEKNIPLVFADKNRIKQVLLNLLSNAVKYSNFGDKINLSGKIIDKDLIISIEDSGIGIPEEKIESIFLPYKQIENNMNVKGTGLGLAISKEIIKLHKGEIRVESLLGQGSKFTIVLPECFMNVDLNESRDKSLKKRCIANDGKNKKILIVEDDRLNQKLLLNILKYNNYDVIFSETGKDGVNRALKDNPDMILMDIHLPDISGVTAMKQIHLKLKNKIPIVALTADAMSGVREKYLKFGFNEYIQKPIDFTKTIDKINYILENYS